MKLEQYPPNRPNFLVVVLLAAVALLILFIVAIFFLHIRGNRLLRHPYRQTPTSQIAPTPETRTLTALV
jgi:hypothetical protein